MWGRWLYAVGGNPEAARRSSIPTRRVLVTVYVLSGLAAGIGGLFTAGLIDGGSPTAGDLAELDSIAAVIIGGAAFAGGRGNVGNALIGAFTIGVIRNALNLHNVDPFYQLMAIGVIVLIAVEADVLRGAMERRVRVAAGDEARMSALGSAANPARGAERAGPDRARREQALRRGDGTRGHRSPCATAARCSRCSATTAPASRR